MARIPGLDPDDLDAFLTRVGDLVASVGQAIRKAVAGLFRSGAPSADELGVVRSRWTSAVDSQVLPVLAEVFNASAAATAEGLSQARRDIEDLEAPDAGEFLEQARNRLVGVGDERWEAARTVLADGVRAGQDMAVLAERVAESAQVSQARAMVIARTEVLAAHNFASLAQARVLDDPAVIKEWLATDDPRTRDSHRAADGQRVRIGEPFKVGGAKLDYPGDPDGPPELVIACRCSIAIDLDDEPTVAAATDFHPGHSNQKVHGRQRRVGWAGITVSDPAKDLKPGTNARYGIRGVDIESQLRDITMVGKEADAYQRMNDHLAERYGASFAEIDHVAILPGATRDTVAGTSSTRSGKVVLGLRPKLEASVLERSEASGFLALGTGSREGVVAHEFAHAMFILADTTTMFRRDPAVYTRAIAAARRAAVAGGMPVDGVDDPDTGLGRVSRYATESDHEAAAEAFAFYHFGGADRPAWVVAWGEALHFELGLDPTPMAVSLMERGR